MYRISKKMEISAMHQLSLDYESKCENPHGHNWIVTVEISGHKLNNNGMLIDFTAIKELIHSKMDHKNLNKIFKFNPTAENIAKWIAVRIDEFLSDEQGYTFAYCSKVRVEETQGNYAEWEAEVK
jgi:6-pyruvoyltetrahydropterin/6-carboxytetrahydropterin synthase